MRLCKTEFYEGENQTTEQFWDTVYTVFENHSKSIIHYCERSELRLHVEWAKVHKKNAKNGQFGEILNATFWGIFKQCDIARFYVVRYGFLCRTKNDLWVWQKVSQLRVTRLIFHYVLTFCLFFLAYLPTDRKEVFFKVWLGRLHVHIRYRTR